MSGCASNNGDGATASMECSTKGTLRSAVTFGVPVHKLTSLAIPQQHSIVSHISTSSSSVPLSFVGRRAIGCGQASSGNSSGLGASRCLSQQQHAFVLSPPGVRRASSSDVTLAMMGQPTSSPLQQQAQQQQQQHRFGVSLGAGLLGIPASCDQVASDDGNSSSAGNIRCAVSPSENRASNRGYFIQLQPQQQVLLQQRQHQLECSVSGVVQPTHLPASVNSLPSARSASQRNAPPRLVTPTQRAPPQSKIPDKDSGTMAQTIPGADKTMVSVGPDISLVSTLPIDDNHKYVRKCRFLKRIICDLLWENAILFDRLQHKTSETNTHNEERRKLVRKLLRRLNRIMAKNGARRNGSLRLPSCIKTLASGQSSIVLPSGASSILLTPATPSYAAHKESVSGKGFNSKDRPLGSKNASSPLASGSQHAKDASVAPPSRNRKKNQSDKRVVQPIPLDSMGRPVFPIQLPGIEVHCLGEIDNKRPGYHSEDLLYPIGFCSSREFAAVNDPLSSSTLYTCTINDNGPEPKFDVSGDDNPSCVYSGRTPDEAVSALFRALVETVAACGLKTLNDCTINKQEGLSTERDVTAASSHSIRKSRAKVYEEALQGSNFAQTLLPLPPGKGALFFGLSIPTIHHLIQGCLGTRKRMRYKPIRYETARTLPSSVANPPSATTSTSAVASTADSLDVYLSLAAFRFHLLKFSAGGARALSDHQDKVDASATNASNTAGISAPSKSATKPTKPAAGASVAIAAASTSSVLSPAPRKRARSSANSTAQLMVLPQASLPSIRTDGAPTSLPSSPSKSRPVFSTYEPVQQRIVEATGNAVPGTTFLA